MSHFAAPTRRSPKFARATAAALFLMLSPLACERSPASDVGGPKVYATRASVGSVITSNVVTTTTICRPAGVCHTRRSNSTLAQKVGEASGFAHLIPRGSSLAPVLDFSKQVDDRQLASKQSGRDPPEIEAGLKNVHLRGRTLSADRIQNGRTWHVELVRDANAQGKLSGVRLYLDGKPVLASNSAWDDFGGAWYRRHTDLTFYRDGKVAVHQEKSFSPIAIEAGDPADHSRLSAEDLTIRAVFAPDYFPDGCPYEVPICEFFQSANPVPLLNGIISGLAWVADSIGTFFNGLWAGAGADATAAMAENAVLTMEAVTEPTLLNITVAIGALARGPITDEALAEIANLFAEWVADWLWAFFL